VDGNQAVVQRVEQGELLGSGEADGGY
jgi:hypothetical protein